MKLITTILFILLITTNVDAQREKLILIYTPEAVISEPDSVDLLSGWDFTSGWVTGTANKIVITVYYTEN